MKLGKWAMTSNVIIALGLLVNAAAAAEGSGGGRRTGPQDLGTLGGSFSQAGGIDVLTNHAAGAANLTGDLATHAVVWDWQHSASIVDLGVLSGGTNSSAAGVTSKGAATGVSDYLDPVLGAIEQRAFFYKNSTLTLLSTLGGSQSSGNAINESNQVAGSSTTADDATTHAFLYNPGSAAPEDLGTLIGPQGNSAAFAINNFGLVAGSSDTGNVDASGNPVTDAVTWSLSGKKVKIHDLGTLGGGYAQANAINSFGVATGFSTLASGQTDAFVYAGGKMIDIGSLGGSTAVGLGINDLGVVVGYSQTAGDTATDAFVWTPATGMVDLNSLLPAGSPWVLTQASAVSDLGKIVGYGLLNGEFHAFIW